MNAGRPAPLRVAAAAVAAIGAVIVIIGWGLEFSGHDRLGGGVIGPGIVIVALGLLWFRRQDRLRRQ